MYVLKYATLKKPFYFDENWLYKRKIDDKYIEKKVSNQNLKYLN